MGHGRMDPTEILAAVQRLLNEASNRGEKLTGASIARRVGCSRTVLYTNRDVRELVVPVGANGEVLSPSPNDGRKVVNHHL